MRLIAGTTPKSSSDSARRLPPSASESTSPRRAPTSTRSIPPGAGAAEFAATDLVVAEPSRLCARLSRLVAGGDGDADWRARSGRTLTESPKRSTVESETGTSRPTTSRSSSTKATRSAWWPTRFPTPRRCSSPTRCRCATSTASSGRRRRASPPSATAASLGSTGIVSSALGAGSATTDDLTLVVGDLALYHDTNGLLALDRCDVDATVVLINNDGGGIFHELPIESFEPEFTESFKTPHGIEFEPMADLHGLAYTRIDARPDSVESAGNVADDPRGCVHGSPRR